MRARGIRWMSSRGIRVLERNLASASRELFGMRFSTHLSKGRAVNLISDDLETPALEFAGKGVVGHFLGMGPPNATPSEM